MHPDAKAFPSGGNHARERDLGQASVRASLVGASMLAEYRAALLGQ
jgi:hypothetical protein